MFPSAVPLILHLESDWVFFRHTNHSSLRAAREGDVGLKNSPCLMGLHLLLLTICSSYDSHFPGSTKELQARFKASSNFLKRSGAREFGHTGREATRQVQSEPAA